MKVIVDGDAVFIAADDFVDLATSDVTWVEVPEDELRDYQRRDKIVAREEERARREAERENERLRWFYDQMRMADRLNLQMVYEAEHSSAQAAQAAQDSEAEEGKV